MRRGDSKSQRDQHSEGLVDCLRDSLGKPRLAPRSAPLRSRIRFIINELWKGTLTRFSHVRLSIMRLIFAFDRTGEARDADASIDVERGRRLALQRRSTTEPISFCISAALRAGRRRALSRAARHVCKAHVVGCSTGGQIRNDEVDDDIAAVALRFERTRLRLACEAVPARAIAFLRRGDRARGCRRRPRRHFRAVRRIERQRQRTGGRRHRVVGGQNPSDRRIGRRQRAVREDTGRRRLRAAERPSRGDRLLWRGNPDRPRQRRRLGRVRPAPPYHAIDAAMYCTSSTARPPSTSTNAISARTTRAACPARRCCFRC